MSNRIALTEDPTQITDGTNYAHITVVYGSVVYADSEDSPAWHLSERSLNISPPSVIWMKKATGDSAAIVVTTFTA